ICGIGSAGAGVLEELARAGLPGVSLALIHSDSVALAAFPEIEKFPFEAKGLSFYGPAAEPKSSEQNPAAALLERMRSFCGGTDVLIIVAGMGGVLGNALAHQVAESARQAGIFCVSFAVFPFECEGNRRAELASEGLKQARQSADLVICWPNQ